MVERGRVGSNIVAVAVASVAVASVAAASAMMIHVHIYKCGIAELTSAKFGTVGSKHFQVWTCWF